MKGSIIVTVAVMMMICALLIAMAPDTLSIVIIILMTVAVAVGFILGIFPAVLYAMGFKNARFAIKDTKMVQSAEPWIVIFKMDSLFRNKKQDKLFTEYKDKVDEQKERDEILADIETYFSEDMLYVHTWQGLVLQIPGTLTGLGILGTFIGLITGISALGFSSLEATLESVAVLINGIELAFYTSIAGVILSILFNIINRIAWNTLLREHVYFTDTFHKEVIPSAEEQVMQKEQSNMRKILSRLDRIPKTGAFSLSAEGSGFLNPAREQSLMPQIRTGIKRGEFFFDLQPRVDLITKKIIGAEALVRWKHETLGILPPSTFMPVLEQNGYIVRLDSQIWELVCRQIRNWIDEGKRPVPISVNISKTDILAMDMAAFFADMLEKYKIPPRSLEMEIAKNAFVQNPGICREVAGALRRMGFKVIMDGFDGDYISVNMLENTEIDALNLDLRFMYDSKETVFADVLEKARKLKVEMYASCIENTEQVSMLVRNSCRIGQGHYFHKSLSVQEFESTFEKQ